MNRFIHLRHKFIEISPWIIAALVALSSHWAAHSIENIINVLIGHGGHDLSIMYFIYIVFFLVMVIILIKVRSAFYRPRTRYMRGEKPEKRENLIIFLSDLNMENNSNDGIPSGIVLEGDLKKDLAKLVKYKKNQYPWRWEMPLRAINYHIGKLKTVTLICSEKSIQQVSLFQNILAKYDALNEVQIQILVKKGNKPVLVHEHDHNQHIAWNFEEFDDLSHGLIFLLKIFSKRKVSEKKIIIDFTGGMKVTSVVAAAITFNRTIKAQYVQTNSPWDVLSYDILLGSGGTGPFEI